MRLAVISMLFVAALAAPRAQGTPSASAGFPPAGQPPILTVVSSGAAPRKMLRYAVTKDYRSHMDMTMALGMTLGMAGMDGQSIPIPPMKLGADLAVTGITPAGEISYSFGFSDISVDSANADPSAAALMQSFAADMKTLHGSMTITNRGESRGTHFDTSQISNPQLSQMVGSLSQSLDGLVMPLPAEAVGVGARWEGRQTVGANGIQMQQKNTWEVQSIEGSDVKVKVTIEQTAGAQPINSAGMPAGAEMSLDKMNGTGTGNATFHLNGLVPTSDVSTSSTMYMSINMGGQAQPVTVAVTAKVGVVPGK
jgi:hypothetical protein